MSGVAVVAAIFISYAQVDREPAKRLAEFLQSSGYSVWWDAGLRPGDIFTIEIQRQINACEHFIVVWSRTSSASFWVTAETTYARTAGKPILPLKIDDCTPPVPFNLLQTIELKSIDASGPAVAQALVKAGTLPQMLPSEAEVQPATNIAESVLRKAQELARWEFIKDSRSAGDFRRFLDRFPDGELADLASMRLEALRWDDVVGAGTSLDALEVFLAEFPDGVKTPEAQRLRQRKRRALEQARWSELRRGLLGWRKSAERRLAEYEAFLIAHPDGAHAEQGRAMVKRLQREVELWRAAASGDNLTTVERYLEEFPFGSFASEAKAHLSRLRRQTRQDRAGFQLGQPEFPIATFLMLSLLGFLVGCIGSYAATHTPTLIALPVSSMRGETFHLLHPYPILIGIFIAWLIHEWGNRSWLTTAIAFTSVLAFRAVAHFVGLPEIGSSGLPINSMVIGALYCFGAWTAGFAIAPYMRRSKIAFFSSILLGSLTYPDWPLLLGYPFEGHSLLMAGVFFVACTMPIAYSLLRSAPLSSRQIAHTLPA